MRRRSEREVEFNVEIYFAKEDRYRAFAEVSPIVRTFEHDAVRRLREAGARVCQPALGRSVRSLGDFRRLVERAIDYGLSSG